MSVRVWLTPFAAGRDEDQAAMTNAQIFRLLDRITDKNMHDLTAYLVTLK